MAGKFSPLSSPFSSPKSRQANVDTSPLLACPCILLGAKLLYKAALRKMKLAVYFCQE